MIVTSNRQHKLWGVCYPSEVMPSFPFVHMVQPIAGSTEKKIPYSFPTNHNKSPKTLVRITTSHVFYLLNLIQWDAVALNGQILQSPFLYLNLYAGSKYWGGIPRLHYGEYIHQAKVPITTTTTAKVHLNTNENESSSSGSDVLEYGSVRWWESGSNRAVSVPPYEVFCGADWEL